MKSNEIRIGSQVAIKHSNGKLGIPMTVTGIFSSLMDIDKATLYLDFEENEGDVFEVEIDEVELIKF